MVTGATDIKTDNGCRRATDMGFGCNPDPDVTMTPGGKQDTGLSPLLTAFASLDLSLSTGHEPFCLSLSSYHTMYLLSIIEPDFLVPQGTGCALFSPPRPKTEIPGWACGSLSPAQYLSTGRLKWHKLTSD